jgi:hypothetical protein
MELKPCPFCGGEVTHEIDSWGSMSWIECRVCGRMLATRCDGLPDDPPSPSMAFNRRPIEDALATRVAELEELWDKTNWKLFHDQKLTLLLLMDGEIDRNAAIDHLEGILSLMDAFQDVAIDRLGIAEADRSFYYPSEDE